MKCLFPSLESYWLIKYDSLPFDLLTEKKCCERLWRQWKESSFVFFCGIKRCNQHPLNFFSKRNEFIIVIFHQTCSFQKRKPINTFTGFFKRNMEFGYKIRFAVTVNCFVYICTYACAERSNCLAIVVSFFDLENSS